MKDGFLNEKSSHLFNEGGNQGGNLKEIANDSFNLLQNNNLAENSFWITAKEGGNLLGVSKRMVKKHCQLGHFVTRPAQMNGGTGYEIELNSILDYLEKRGKIEKKLEILKALTPDSSPKGRGAVDVGKRMGKVARARYDLVKLFEGYLKNTTGKKIKRKNQFIAAYNSGAYPEIFEILGKIKSWKTINRWIDKLRENEGDPTCLEPQYKPKEAAISAEEAEIILKLLLHPNRLPISEVIYTAKARMIVEGIAVKSDASYRRWIESWRRKNYDLYVLSREGSKAFNDKILPYIKRDYDKIEVGDILIADGHILDFEIINPITGKPKRMMLVLFFDMKSSMPLGFEIMPTENTMAIASALRRSILVLGFTPRIVYLDNGRAFRGKYFTGVKNFETSGLQGLFARIGVNAVFAKPYHGQSKTIERFFGVLAQFERRLPSYVGNSVANKPARLMRNEKLHRRFFDGVYPTLQSMAANLVEFFREYSLREHQGGFYKGHTPAEIFNESLPRVKSLPDFEERIIEPRELDYLMMSEESRMVGRNGVRLFGKYYFNEALLSIKDKVTVRYDFTDLSRVLVFDVRNNFICEATDEINKLHHPMARLLGTEEEINELSNSLKIKGRIEKSAKREAAEVFEKINAEESLYKFDYQLPAASEKPKRIRKSDREKDVDEFFNQWNKANPF